jgi:hypothetical protein
MWLQSQYWIFHCWLFRLMCEMCGGEITTRVNTYVNSWLTRLRSTTRQASYHLHPGSEACGARVEQHHQRKGHLGGGETRWPSGRKNKKRLFSGRTNPPRARETMVKYRWYIYLSVHGAAFCNSASPETFCTIHHGVHRSRSNELPKVLVT